MFTMQFIATIVAAIKLAMHVIALDVCYAPPVSPIAAVLLT
jgi:hypothetical protein